MKVPGRRLAGCAVIGCLLPRVLFASADAPTLEFSFASPFVDREELVELLTGGLRPLGFAAGPVTNVRPNGFFRITYTSADAGDVLLRGPLSCVTVTIYTTYNDVTGIDGPSKAKEIQGALLDQLRAAAGDEVLVFRASPDEPCTHAL
jgi:hypothetical protein